MISKSVAIFFFVVFAFSADHFTSAPYVRTGRGPSILRRNNRRTPPLSRTGHIYDFKFAEYVKEPSKYIPTVPKARYEPLFVCTMTHEDKMEICAEALDALVAQYDLRGRVKFVKNERVGPMKLYEINPLHVGLPDDISYTENMYPTPFNACKCPTSPAIYLRGKPTETVLHVTVDTRGMEFNDKIRNEVKFRYVEIVSPPDPNAAARRTEIMKNYRPPSPRRLLWRNYFNNN